MNDNIKPTESELEILKILWSMGECTVRKLHEVLEQNKDEGHTTTLKLMQIMHDKNLLTRDVSARSHVYSANVTR